MVISEATYQAFIKGEIDGLYRESFASLMAYAARQLTDYQAMMAEDCVQEAIVKAYRERDNFHSLFQFKAFLFTCFHNSCVSILRKDKSMNRYLQEQETTEDSIMATMVEQEVIDILFMRTGLLTDTRNDKA